VLLIRPGALRKRYAWSGRARPAWPPRTTLAERGHEVHLFEAPHRSAASSTWRRKIPGKEEFSETLRYFFAPPGRHRRAACTEHAQ